MNKPITFWQLLSISGAIIVLLIGSNGWMFSKLWDNIHTSIRNVETSASKERELIKLDNKEERAEIKKQLECIDSRMVAQFGEMNKQMVKILIVQNKHGMLLRQSFPQRMQFFKHERKNGNE